MAYIHSKAKLYYSEADDRFRIGPYAYNGMDGWNVIDELEAGKTHLLDSQRFDKNRGAAA